MLKDLITYFRDIQKTYESRSKSLYTLSNVISNITAPPQFRSNGGISDAYSILRDYHKQSIAEGNKAKSIEEEVIVQLTGLRSDLAQKIKEIKSLSGDFKNNVDKETEGTRRAVRDFQNALETSGTDPRSDPYLIRLGVDRQLGRQIEEENYLHRVCILDETYWTRIDIFLRHFLTLKAQGASLSPSWWEKSKRLTVRIPGSSKERQTTRMRQSRSCIVGHWPFQEITSGMLSSIKTSISSIHDYQSAG